MDRRHFIASLAKGAALAGLAGCQAPALSAQEPRSPRQAGALKITKVKAILTAPAKIRLVVVKVETSEPGLYGLGCATFTQRARVVETAVTQYLDPFLRGKDPDNIEDLWQAMYQSSYWRNGPCLMNAISGVDMALWDIKGKQAGMPVYQLLGGKCRVAAPVYRHASGNTFEEVTQKVKAFLEEGYKHVRIQVGVPGQSAYGARPGETPPPLDGEGHFQGRTFEPSAYCRIVPKLFEHVRKELGDEVELLHDMHERPHPIQAMAMVKEVEKYHPFFMEDPFSPEDVGYFKVLRPQTATPIAMGELFNNPNEWVDLVSNRLIDFIRCHLSQIGGLSPARKVAALCEFFRVRSAWHGPGDVSPVGHAANLHLDLAIWNFGIQEATIFNETAREVFPGTPEVKNGMMWANDKPGLGIDLNEELAAKFPVSDEPPFDLDWGRLRGKDGTIRRP
ncbi:MAG TPA: enolase C-terminal domain-like protein [Planctomycetota bacterium]|jgi:mannonate dehydratase|nr:enolase C-terminal domain-like protein [Planctomycetota bacterium]